MKIGILAFLCLVTAQAFASSADSGGCPWKMPFTIHVHAVGTTSRYKNYSEPPQDRSTEAYSPTVDSNDFDFTIDTAIFSTFRGDKYVITEFSVSRDTLWYNYWYTDTVAPYFSHTDSVIIAFVPHKDSILSITCTFGDDYSYKLNAYSNRYSLSASSLAFDDTSIYCSDIIENHDAEFTVSRETIDYFSLYSTDYGTFDNSNFKATTISLSGNFRRHSFLIDSTIQHSPLQLPFQIFAHTVGTEDSAGQSFPSSQDFSWSVPNVPLINDVLQYTDSYNEQGPIPNGATTSSYSFKISFVHGTDSIASIRINTSYGSNVLGDTSYSLTFQISSVAYDSTTIFTRDSSFCAHNISLTWSASSYNESSGFAATSAILSGIFRPTHYTCAESVSESPRENASLKVYPLNNSLQCSFAASVAPRSADVYSLLGTQIASSQVPAGTTEVTIANLAPGFYFVRLGNEVAKAIIP